MYRDPLEPRNERRRHWSGAATAIVLIGAVAAGLAVWSWQAADDARDEAFITPPATIDNPAPIPQAGRDLAGEREAFNEPALTPAPFPAPAGGGIENAVATPGGDMGIAPAGFDRGLAAAAVPEATTPPTVGGGNPNIAEAPVGRDFAFQPLPRTPAADVMGGMAALGGGGGNIGDPAVTAPAGGDALVAQGAVPPVRGDAAAADAMVGVPTGDRAAPPAEIAVQTDIGKTPETQRLENAGDITAAIVGGQEATVKGKVQKFDEQARTLTLENGDAYVLADNLTVGEGTLKADVLTAGNDVQVVYRTDAEKKIVISVTDLPEQAGGLGGTAMPVPAAN